jgi:hypothetical protein
MKKCFNQTVSKDISGLPLRIAKRAIDPANIPPDAPVQFPIAA